MTQRNILERSGFYEIINGQKQLVLFGGSLAVITALTPWILGSFSFIEKTVEKNLFYNNSSAPINDKLTLKESYSMNV